MAFCFGAVVVFYHPTARRLIRRKKFSSASAIGINFREFTFQELVEATDGFNKILGQGSSGKVVRGNLHIDGVDVEIAVKVLDKMTERTETEFVTELRIIGRTYHKNLVRLLGYCVENKKQLLLVYELMPNGALSRILFNNGENPNCNWTQRVEIAKGIARGLAYLHEECETQIIHCDVKPQKHAAGCQLHSENRRFWDIEVVEEGPNENKHGGKRDGRVHGTGMPEGSSGDGEGGRVQLWGNAIGNHLLQKAH